MIKINLSKSELGRGEDLKKGSSRGFSAFGDFKDRALGGDTIFMDTEATRRRGLVNLLTILIFPLILYTYEFLIIPTKRAEVGQKQNTLNELLSYNQKADSSVNEITKFTEEQEKVQKRIAALNNITKNRLLEIRILDYFQQIVPEKLWFTRLSSDGSKIFIEGMSASDGEINGFTEKLQQNAFFKSVELLSSVEETSDNLSFKKFQIACILKSDGSKKIEVN